MALKDTMNTMDKLLSCLSSDLKKAAKGNKAAGQRVRTCSIKFAKAAKVFRKESIRESGKKKKTAKKSRKASRKKTTTKKVVKTRSKRKTIRRRR